MAQLRYIGRCGAMALTLLVGTCACAFAAQHFALATSSTDLYVLRTEGTWAGGKSWSRAYRDSTGAAFSAVATDGNYVYMADSAGATLYVGQITSLLGAPSMTLVKAVNLRNADSTKSVRSPFAVTVDSSGGVYVIGQRFDNHSYYAYVKPTAGDWANPVLQLDEIPNSLMADVAMLKSGTSAITALQLTTSDVSGQAYVANVTPVGPGSTATLGDKCYVPQALTVNTTFGTEGYAYVVNRVANENLDVGSLRTLDADTHQPVGVVADELLPNMIPDDVTTFAVGATQYLGIIGKNDGVDQAWKIALGAADGRPALSGKTSANTVASSQHQTAASSDGEVFWFTSWQQGTVGAWNTDTWSPLAGFNGLIGSGVNVKSITGYDPTFVPEPSSLASLAGLVGAAIGLVRRRKV